MRVAAIVELVKGKNENNTRTKVHKQSIRTITTTNVWKSSTTNKSRISSKYWEETKLGYIQYNLSRRKSKSN